MTFIQAPLYLELARLLARDAAGGPPSDEAIYWALRAVASDDWGRFEAIALYVRLLRESGAEETSRRAFAKALEQASGKHDEVLVRRLLAAQDELFGADAAPAER